MTILKNEFVCECVKHADAVDRTPTEIKQILGHDMFITNHYETEHYDIEHMISCNTDDCILSFRGTEPKDTRDWGVDFNAWQVPYGNTETPIRVHKGFYDAYQLIRPKIHEWMDEFKKYSDRIVITGHSLGGALATLCAVDLHYNYRGQVDFKCCTFGSPRVFNKEGMKSFNHRLPDTIRVTNRYDLVPNVPFMIMGYQHVGVPVVIGNGIPFLEGDVFNHDIRKCYIPYIKGE
jgi:predicted lipase